MSNAIEPDVWFDGKTSFQGKDETIAGHLGAAGVPPTCVSGFSPGVSLRAEDGQVAIVHEFLLYRLGLTGDDEAAARRWGRRIRFEYDVGQF